MQGSRRPVGLSLPAGTNPADLMHASPEERAAALGLPKGLIRTSTKSESMSAQSSRQLFGHAGGGNPAQQARVKRERAAQRALAKARRVIDAKRDGKG